MISGDYHVHSDISPDGKGSMEVMCEAAIQKGLKEIAFTDHYECYCDGVRSRHFNRAYLERYFRRIEECREKFEGKLIIKAGLELGQSHIDRDEAAMVTEFPFEFILGSVHKLGNVDLTAIRLTEYNGYIIADTYYRELEKLAEYGIYDCIGHLDYIRKQFIKCGLSFEEDRYEEIVGRILRCVIERGKGIEVNTACLGCLSDQTMPDIKILKQYKSLGGTRVKAGSDAHTPERVGCGFEEAERKIKEAGL